MLQLSTYVSDVNGRYGESLRGHPPPIGKREDLAGISQTVDRCVFDDVAGVVEGEAVAERGEVDDEGQDDGHRGSCARGHPDFVHRIFPSIVAGEQVAVPFEYGWSQRDHDCRSNAGDHATRGILT
jgi:hypothetical protein